MKVSKSLIKAIFVGVTIGTTATSCSMFDSVISLDEPETNEQAHERADEANRNGNDGNTCWDCPACGLG